MDNLPAISVSKLLDRYGLHPDRSLGQNFLVDEAYLANVAAAADIQPDDDVLEIGPGLGGLTRHLARLARRVVAVELDRRLIPPLNEVLVSFQNVSVIEGDILSYNPAALGLSSGYLVVANIPYYITSALVRHLLEAEPHPAKLVLTVQEEVAQRMVASPGKLSLLALSVQLYGQPRILGRIPAGAFYPPPKVDSAIIRVDLYGQPRISPALIGTFFRLAKAGFSQKRKTVKNALSAGMAMNKDDVEALLQSAGIESNRRAETISLDEWGVLTGLYVERMQV